MFSRLFGEKRSTIGQGAADGQTLVALEKLQTAADGMLKKKEFYEKRAENEVSKAKECLRKNNKSGATLALRRKKMIVAKIDGLENSYLQLQEQILELESVQTTTEMFAAMKHAAAVQKRVLAKNNAEKVSDVMEDLQDAKQNMQDIQEALDMGGMQSAEFDEADLEKELAALEAEDLDAELLAEPRVVGAAGISVTKTRLKEEDSLRDSVEDLPPVPKERPTVAKKKNTETEASELLAELL